MINQTIKDFSNEFPISEEGLGQKMHGYLYLKYINLYVYKMRDALARLLPNPEDATRPSGDYSAVEDLIDMGVAFTNKTAGSLKTNGYHAKVMLMQDVEKFFKLQEDVNLPNLPKSVIPYERARRVIINHPGRILLLECACRTSRGEKGCYPRDVCMLIGEPWVSFALEHNKESHPRLICQEEALQIIKSQHEKGNIQAAFFKDSCGDRLYGFCNCCACCCVALAAQNYAKAPLFANSGYYRTVDKTKCVNCGSCVSACHFNILQMVNGKVEWEYSKCLGCGICAEKCPHNAITMKLADPSVSQPLDFDVLIPKYTEKKNA